MMTVRPSKKLEYINFVVNYFSHQRWKKLVCVVLIILCMIQPGLILAIETYDNRSNANQPPHRQQPRQENIASKPGYNGANGGSNENNGIIQIIETEVWDASENVWKVTERGSRWTNEKGHVSPSPAEVVPPEGWRFLGDWKIVVSSSSNEGSKNTGLGGGGDSKGWEYQFHYLQQPKRRRIWLRSLSPISSSPLQPKSSMLPSRVASKPFPITESAKTKISKIQRTSRFTRAMRQIRDDWNYKGLGFNLYKSFIFPSSIGVAIRLPLSINFDTFDRNPAWPIVSSSAAVFWPPMTVGYLSTSVHVEWLKWIFMRTLAIPMRLFFLILYRFILPTLWTVISALLFPFKGLYSLPPLPTRIPDGVWWTGSIAKPQYNPEMSERIGCSVSYRWSQKRGFEPRVTFWHTYLPTILLYQQFLSQLKGSIASGSSSTTSQSSSSLASSASQVPRTKTKSKANWLRKHTASLGVTTGGPIPDTPHISCSANLSLAGLYWGARRVASRDSFTTSTIAITEGSRPKAVTEAIGGVNNNANIENVDNFEDPTRIRPPPIKKGTSLS